MALCRSAGYAGENSAGSDIGDLSHRIGARAFDRICIDLTVAGGSQFARESFTIRRGRDSHRVRPLPTCPLSPPEVGGYARRLSRPHLMVIPDGFDAWRRIDVGADSARLASY